MPSFYFSLLFLFLFQNWLLPGKGRPSPMQKKTSKTEFFFPLNLTPTPLEKKNPIQTDYTHCLNSVTECCKLFMVSVTSSASVFSPEYLEVVWRSLASENAKCPLLVKKASDSLVEKLKDPETFDNITKDFKYSSWSFWSYSSCLAVFCEIWAESEGRRAEVQCNPRLYLSPNNDKADSALLLEELLLFALLIITLTFLSFMGFSELYTSPLWLLTWQNYLTYRKSDSPFSLMTLWSSSLRNLSPIIQVFLKNNCGLIWLKSISW